MGFFILANTTPQGRSHCRHEPKWLWMYTTPELLDRGQTAQASQYAVIVDVSLIKGTKSSAATEGSRAAYSARVALLALLRLCGRFGSRCC